MQNKFTLTGTGVGVIIISYLLVQLVLSLIMVLDMFIFKTDIQYGMGFMMLSFILSMGVPIVTFDYFVVRKQTGRPLSFSFKKLPVLDYILPFFMMLGMTLISESIAALVPTSEGWLAEWYRYVNGIFKQMQAEPVGMFIMIVGLAPLLEEILFRGIIQRGLINKGLAPKQAIFLSALIFGLVHGNPWQFIGAAMLGLVLGLAYYKTKSILLPILLHAFNNLLSFLMMFYSDKETLAEWLGLNLWFGFFVGILIFGGFYYLFMHRKIHHIEK